MITKKLTKKKELLFSFAGFGPNFLMLIISLYIVNAFMTASLDGNAIEFTLFNKTVVSVFVYSVLITIAKVIDAVIDVPLAAITDRLQTKWGKRRPAILAGLIVATATYLLLVLIPMDVELSMFNTIMIPIILAVFYSAYTLTLVTYYGSFAEVTKDTKSRARISNFKAFFDTVSYSLGYALIPLIAGVMNIGKIALYSSPLMLTMLIPLFLIKEKSTLPKDIEANADGGEAKEERVGFIESIKIAFSNKNYMKWMLVFGFFFFGLQLFISGQIILASGPMGLNTWQIAIMNTAAFAPVPLMLFIYNLVMKKFGFGIAFKSAIIAFIIALTCFVFAYVEIFPGDENLLIRLMIGLTGSTIGSYSIGAFFMAPYMIPSQLAKEEMERTGKNNSAMFFAVQGLITAGVTAISGGIVLLNLREWTVDGNTNFGTHFMLYVAIVACAIAFALSFILPKVFSDIGKKPVEQVKFSDDNNGKIDDAEKNAD